MCPRDSKDVRGRYVLDEVGLVGAGSVDRGSGSGLLAAATQGDVGATEERGQGGHRELKNRRDVSAIAPSLTKRTVPSRWRAVVMGKQARGDE